MGHSTTEKKKDINEDEHSDWFSDHSASTESRESTTSRDSISACSDDNSSSTKKLGWLMKKTTIINSRNDVSDRKNEGPRSHVEAASDLTVQTLKKKVSKASEMEMLKEHFTKLLLCEDMSGHGNGVCTALAISNAITNLCANVFGQLWRLEPLTPDKKLTWKRDMEWLLSVCNHIVEFAPTWQTFPNGTTSEVMCCRPRSDLYVNLPALRKLDNMLLDILNGFSDNTELWYVDKGGISPSPESHHGGDKSAPVPKSTVSVKDKWWLPVPRVPLGGLKKHTIKALTHKRDCANQIHKAAKAINTMTLADMEVPESYYNNLPKNARACLGDVIHSNIASEHFAPDCLLDCLDLSSDRVALEIANRVETAIYVWRRRHHHQLVAMKSPADHRANKGRSSSKSSWGIGRDHRNEEFLARRAESLLLCLRQRFPNLGHTTLDDSKIQCNKDIGKAILESYSRVLSSLALSITSRIEDVLYVDEITKQTDKLSLMKKLGLTPCRKVSIPHRVPVSGTHTPVRTTTPSNYRSPVPSFLSPISGPKTPCKNGNDSKILQRGLGVRRVLANYIGGDVKAKSACGGNVDDVSDKTIVGRRLF